MHRSWRAHTILVILPNAQAGDYIFISTAGCTSTLSITVEDPCTPERFAPEYTVDGIPGSGDTTITVVEGTPVFLDLVQTGVDFSITPPNWYSYKW